MTNLGNLISAARRRPRIGVEILPSEIRIAEVVGVAGDWRLACSGVMGRLDAGDVLDETDARRLESLLFRRGARGTEVVVSAPAESLVHATMNMPPASSDAPFAKLARAELERLRKLEQTPFEFSAWSLPATGSRHEMMVIGCKTEPADALAGVLELAGLRVAGMDDPTRAMARAVHGEAAGGDAFRVIVCVEADACVLAVHRGGVQTYARALPELRLRDHGRSLSVLGTAIAEEVRACVGFERHRCRSSADFVTVLCGVGGTLPTLRAVVGEALAIDVRPFAAPDGGEVDARFAGAIGLALLEDAA
ncbi:MAG: hypothetical protein AAFX79_03750 [Planctomycetota bacterium]